MFCTTFMFRITGLFLLCTSLLACSRESTAIKLKGSDTVLPIAQGFAERLGETQPDLEISVTGGGSGVGIASLMSNTTDIAMASRDIRLGERLRLQDKNMAFRKDTIAWDALAVVVHPNNPVKQLTREQLEAIYTGKTTDWKDVGGAPGQIVVYSRESSSGTHEFFREAVLDGKEFAPTALMMPATGAIIQSVSQTPASIGYVGIAYLNPQVQAVSVSYDQGKRFVPPSVANARNRSYPIVRPLFFLYLENKRARVAPFMDYVMSAAGQAEVARQGFIPTMPHAADPTHAQR